MVAPNNPGDMQRPLAKSYTHPVTSWSLSGGGREHIYLIKPTDFLGDIEKGRPGRKSG